MDKDDIAQHAVCKGCGSGCDVRCVGYSCPVVYEAICDKCGNKEIRFGEGIKVLSEDEARKLRPHWFDDTGSL